MKVQTKRHDRLTFLKSKVNIETVIDVGVQECTPYLMKAFPEKKHVLFEMIDDWKQTINDNYKDIEYDLYTVALSDVTGEMHRKVEPFHLKKLQEPTRKIDYFRLDDILPNEPAPYLIKIDVDGDELKVITGALRTLQKASVVIIEGRLHGPINMLAVMNFMAGVHFKLWDMFNFMCHDDGQLEQCELVFLSRVVYRKATVL